MAADPASRGFLLTDSVRRIERDALARLPAGTLMDRAAEALADASDLRLRRLPAGAPVIALIGPGDNGADALLAALKLRERGYRCVAYALRTTPPASDDARAVHRRWSELAGPPRPLAHFLADGHEPLAALVIDGLFGIGLDRALEGEAAAAVARLARSRLPVVAVDVPSGLDASRGAVVGGAGASAVRADCTVTMIADKPGLHTGEGVALAGEVRVASLGLELTVRDGEAIDREWVRARFAPRGANTHKGSFGTGMAIGGAQGMAGAVLLAARGAQAAGAGKIIAASPDLAPFDPGQPQLMSRHLGPDADVDALRPATAIAVGCGLGAAASARAWLAAALDSALALVVDADGLNLLAREPAQTARLLARAARAPTVLTPHPLEAARLLRCEARDVQADRIGAATRLALESGATVLLKGAGTIVAAPTGRWAIVCAGGPALASAGTGDVLAGVVLAMLCQGHDAFDAAALAAWLHGTAGDRWAAAHPLQAGLSAAMLPELVTETLNAI